MGKFILDLFKTCFDSPVMNYYLQLVSYGLFPVLLSATWVTNTSASFIDNFSTSNSETIIRKGINICNNSDHHPTFFSICLNGSAYHRPQVLTYKINCQAKE